MGFLDKVGKFIGDELGGVYHAVTGTPNASEKRAQATLVNDQINAYKEQTNIARNEINRNRDEQVAEKRKINEKQIRALRRNYRPAGFLNNAGDSSVAGGLVQNLGG